jgi:dTDP-glucose pyrophosphorylase
MPAALFKHGVFIYIMKIVMPMAGLGSRFSAVGITTPKPLIMAKGKPLVKWATGSLDSIDPNDLIFIVRKEHVISHKVDMELKRLYDGATIIVIDKPTDGAACTVLKARDLINSEESLLILDCDIYFRSARFEQMIRHLPSGTDGVLPVFLAEGDKWSFSRVDENWNVKEVAEKKRISDYGIIGAYFFAHGRDFVAAAEKLIEENRRSNSEFYIAPVFQELINSGMKIVAVPVSKFWNLGTPSDMEIFIEKYHVS